MLKHPHVEVFLYICKHVGNKSNNSSYLLVKPGKNYSDCYSTKYTDVNMDFPRACSTGFPLICLLSKHKFPHVELH